MRLLLSFPATVLLALASVIPMASAQKYSPAQRILNARTAYYTPTANGLKSFSCNVDFDWKAFLKETSGKDIDDANPFLTYVKSVRLSVTDDLRGSGGLLWDTNGLPPDSIKGQVDTMRRAFQQMMGGFFQTWNSFMNGGMVPKPDESTTVTQEGDRLIMNGKSQGTNVTETFDKNVLLTDAHVTTPDVDVLVYPAYVDSEDGRIISNIRSIYHAPPSAPATEVSMAVTYNIVSSFRIPSSVILSVKNAGSFAFRFVDCNVKQ